jgi:hypothetical protein
MIILNDFMVNLKNITTDMYVVLGPKNFERKREIDEIR